MPGPWLVVDVVNWMVVGRYETEDAADLSVEEEPEWVAWRLLVRPDRPGPSASSSTVLKRGKRRTAPPVEAVP